MSDYHSIFQSYSSCETVEIIFLIKWLEMFRQTGYGLSTLAALPPKTLSTGFSTFVLLS